MRTSTVTCGTPVPTHRHLLAGREKAWLSDAEGQAGSLAAATHIQPPAVLPPTTEGFAEGTPAYLPLPLGVISSLSTGGKT